MIYSIPHEISIGGVYLPPALIAVIWGVLATVVTTRFLDRYRLTQYFFYPPIVAMSLTIIYTILIGVFVIGM
ncbi:MAG: hypothetical protein ACI9N9_002985 [Enterobacterales bacterium]|jgi:hypothetical protein